METGNEMRGRDPAAAFEDVKQRAVSGMEELKDRARERAEELGADFGGHAENIAEAVRSAGDSLRGKEDWLADAAQGLGRSLERLTATAREKGFDGIKRDVEQLARERPLIFMGSAVAIGLALGRVLRSRPPADRAEADGHERSASATAGSPEQLAAGAGWPSDPDAVATPMNKDMPEGRT
jgi:hypothetical protein